MSSANSIHRGAWPRSFESLVGEFMDSAALRPLAADRNLDIQHRCLVVHDQVDDVIARAYDLRQSRRQCLWRVARLGRVRVHSASRQNTWLVLREGVRCG